MLMPKQFQCYLVQKTGSVFHPAKLASGANYPVGWVQMPHSMRSVGGCTGQGQKTWGVGWSGERSRPGVRAPRLCRFHLRAGATAASFLSFFLFITNNPSALLQSTSSWKPPSTTTAIRWWPTSRLHWFNKRLGLTWAQTKPICVFFT